MSNSCNTLCKYFSCLSDLGKLQLSQKMKDYLASKLSFKVWKNILYFSFSTESANYIEEILINNKEQYDRSYAAIRKVIETGRVENASQMEAIVKQFHKTFAEKFRNSFLEGWYLYYSFRKKFIVFEKNLLYFLQMCIYAYILYLLLQTLALLYFVRSSVCLK